MFTVSVARTLKQHWRTFTLLVMLYGFISIVVGAVTNQDSLNLINESLNEINGESILSGFESMVQLGAVSVVAFSGSAENLSDVQRVCAALAFLLMWMTVVWLLREYLAGRSPRLRDGLYSSASPLLPTALVCIWIIVQFLPVGLLTLIYNGLTSVGLATAGFGLFLASSVAVLVVALTLYWVTSSFVALVVVTLPGMYPGRAIRLAGDLVVGRRLRIMLRLIWTAFLVFIAWLIVMVPLLFLDRWLRTLADWVQYIPYVPLVAALMSATTILWMSTYVYLLYRKLVDDDAAPA